MPCAAGSFDIVFVSFFNPKNQVWMKSLFEDDLDSDSEVSGFLE